MSRKRILFVGEDLALWEQLQEAQFPNAEAPWDVAFAKTGLQALASLTQSPCDAVVADMQMPGMSGAQLLDEVIQRSPSTLRFIRASLADQGAAMKCVGTAHQYLLKPSDATTIGQALERAFALESWLPSETVQKLIAQMKKLPSPPNLYFKIVAELQSPDSSIDHIGSLVAQDPVLSAKMLQVVNSAVFGLQLQVVSAAEAVLYLGMETAKALVLLAHTFSYFDKVRTADFSVETLWRHCVSTGKLAEKIARAQGGGAEAVGQAFTAGMLHDIGKLLLAANLPDAFKASLQKAREDKVQLWEAENSALGTTHAELGACLLGIWGLPTPIVEAVALHHYPTRFLSKQFCPLTAVHVANAFDYELRKDKAKLPGAVVDLNYLAELEVAEQLEAWRDLCQEKLL
jgi:putative nucleotidyltransferase with HDIG domain